MSRKAELKKLVYVALRLTCSCTIFVAASAETEDLGDSDVLTSDEGEERCERSRETSEDRRTTEMLDSTFSRASTDTETKG